MDSMLRAVAKIRQDRLNRRTQRVLRADRMRQARVGTDGRGRPRRSVQVAAGVSGGVF